MTTKKKYQPIGPAFKKEDWDNIKKGGNLQKRKLKDQDLKPGIFIEPKKMLPVLIK